MKTVKRNTQIHKDKVGKVLEKEPFYFIRWVLIAWVIILAIMFSFGAIFNAIPEITKFKIKYSIESFLLKEKNNEQNSIFFVLEAVRKNEYLNEENKQFIEEFLIPEIKENIEFINLNEVAERLETLDVEYNKKFNINLEDKKILLNNQKETTLGVAGKYNSFFNRIDVYEQINIEDISEDYFNKSYDFNAIDKTVYFHELNHVLTVGKIESAMSFVDISKKDVFSELINELFAREYYLEETFNGYENQINYMYALAEIIPSEVLKKYKFENNEAILIKEFLKIDNNIEKVFDLINTVKIINKNPTDENYKKIHDAYEYFYEKKYNEKIIENGNMLAYFYGSKVLNNEEEKRFEYITKIDKTITNIRIIPKGYISEECKELYPYTKLEYVKNGKLQTSKIDL